MKQRIIEYDRMRILLTLLVVFGHNFYLSIYSNYGGIYYHYYNLETGKFCKFLKQDAKEFENDLKEVKKNPELLKDNRGFFARLFGFK